MQDVAHCDASWEPLRVAVGEAANECFAGNQERPWERDRMCKEAAAERLNMVRERVRLQNELGGASEGIGKELADKLAFSSSLSKDEEEIHEGSTETSRGGTAGGAHKTADVRGTQIGPQSGVQMPRNTHGDDTTEQREMHRRPRNARHPSAKKLEREERARICQGMTKKARDQTWERHGTPVELTRDEREKVGAHVKNDVKDMTFFLKNTVEKSKNHSGEDAVLAAEA